MWVRNIFAGSLSHVELSSSKDTRARCPVLGSLRSTSFFFLRVFACSLGLPFPLHGPLSTKDQEDPLPLLDANKNATRHSPRRSLIEHDSTRTYPRSCFPVIYLLSIRHSSYRYSNPSTSPLEQAGGPSMLFSFSPLLFLSDRLLTRVYSPNLVFRTLRS